VPGQAESEIHELLLYFLHVTLIKLATKELCGDPGPFTANFWTRVMQRSGARRGQWSRDIWETWHSVQSIGTLFSVTQVCAQLSSAEGPQDGIYSSIFPVGGGTPLP
jgi:hypothetical protein